MELLILVDQEQQIKDIVEALEDVYLSTLKQLVVEAVLVLLEPMALLAMVDLVEMDVRASRAELMAAILAELAAAMQQFEQQGMQSALEQWPDWHAHEGREVMLRAPDGNSHTGLARGLDEAGNLLLKMPGGETRKFGAGEVSLRPVAAK